MTPDTDAPLLPASTQIGRVSLQVADLDRSRRFYEELIGFRPIDFTAERGRRLVRLGVGGDSDDGWLVELREKPGVRPVPPRGLIGLYHFAVLLPDRADLGRFISHAVSAGARMGAADHLVSEALYLTDPDGLQIEIYADRPRALWPQRDGQIELATLPLDVDAIVASAGSTTWTGMPAGTGIGHVHFYVGDIPAARQFYVTTLGFDAMTSDIPGALFVAAGGYHHHVGLNTWAARAPAATDADARMLFWELVLPDREHTDAVAERLDRAGYAVSRTDGSPTAADPWGITVKLQTGRG
jgi:catechol 2,3-dioxygenase